MIDKAFDQVNFDHEGFFEEDFPVITSLEEKEILEEELPEEIGILTLKNTVLYPSVVIPITVGRDMHQARFAALFGKIGTRLAR